MGLFRRVNDIISANLNDMVNRFEHPEKMLNQAVREMADKIETATQSAAQVIADERILAKQLTDYRQQFDQCTQRARAAVSRGDDNAARRELIRKSELESLIAALDEQHAAVSESGRRLRTQLNAMRVRLVEAKRKLVTLTARTKAADARKRLATDLNDGAEIDSAFQKFDRLATDVERSEAEADCLLELTGSSLPEDENEPAVEAELAALKAEMELEPEPVEAN